MIISPGRGYVFVHIPKTGGTSLTLALEARAKADDLIISDTPKGKRRRARLKGAATRGRLWKHARLGDIEGLLPDPVLDGLFAFTLVRNPWDRAVSYYHWLRTQRFDHPAVARARAMTFEQFASHPDTFVEFARSPASAYMRRSDGRAQRALFIRLEHFAKDAAPLVAHLGFPLELPWENRSPRRREYQSYYSDTTVQTIAQACAEDIQRFGYRFA